MIHLTVHGLLVCSFYHSLIQWLPLLATFKIDFFVPRGCDYIRSSSCEQCQSGFLPHLIPCWGIWSIFTQNSHNECVWRSSDHIIHSRGEASTCNLWLVTTCRGVPEAMHFREAATAWIWIRSYRNIPSFSTLLLPGSSSSVGYYYYCMVT